jgi:hypothetical protein
VQAMLHQRLPAWKALHTATRPARSTPCSARTAPARAR